MEIQYKGNTYFIEWDSFEEVYVFDEEGNDVPYDYELYDLAYSMVWDYIVDAADIMRDRIREEHI